MSLGDKCCGAHRQNKPRGNDPFSHVDFSVKKTLAEETASCAHMAHK